MSGLVFKGLLILATLLAAGVVLLLIIFYQGRRQPAGDAQYVAMGSSFAAGIGLGPRAPGSPFLAMRTINSYPQQLARLLHLPLVDVTSSGATTKNILHGGQYFQPPQLDALSLDTKLVTITSGGNDVHYVGDLSLLAARNSPLLTGWLARHFWNGPMRADLRDYDKLRRDLVEVVAQVRLRSPHARIVLLTYPLIVPPTGSCGRLSLTEGEAREMAAVGHDLSAATRAAASESHALLVDLERIGADHHACAAAPWVNGWIDVQGTKFHPTLLGARKMAAAVALALQSGTRH
jgi:lysophospholipase L1-like esterase